MFRWALVCLFLICQAAGAMDFSRYHTQAEINQTMRDLAVTYPSLVHFYVLGESDEHREISYITITKDRTGQAPALYFNGTHHGNEWSSTEGILGLIDYLIAHRDDAAISPLLSRYIFYLQPLVNPDGHAAQTREDVNGKDPNRDYAYPGGGEMFHTRIIQVMKSLLDKVKFRAAVAYHSGIEEVLWSWCYTDAHIPDYDLLYTVAKKGALAMGFDRYLQSYDDYETKGEFIDYLYMTARTLAFTFEVSNDLTPPESDLAAIVERSVKGAMAVVNAISDYDTGRLHVESGPARSDKRRDPRWARLGRKLE